MNRKMMILVGVLIVVFNLIPAQAKYDPYVEDPKHDWGDLSNPASIWKPDALAVHAGRLDSASDVDAFTVTFDKPNAKFLFDILVPVCGQHFANFRPSVALIGPGLDTPPDGTLPFDLPKGMGAQVFLDERNINGTRIAVPTNDVTYTQPVYAFDVHGVQLAQAGNYFVAVWEPHGNIGGYMLSTIGMNEDFEPRSQAELDKAFNQLFSGAWMGQDCNAPLAVPNCAAASPVMDNTNPSTAKKIDTFVLIGIVRDMTTCQPIHDAEINFTLLGNYSVNEKGVRGKIFSDAQGSYQIETSLLPAIDLPGHILVTITASGYQMAVADYTIQPDSGSADTFDLALQPQS